MAVDPYASPPPTRRDYFNPPGAPARQPRPIDYYPPGSPTVFRGPLPGVATDERVENLARAVLCGEGRIYSPHEPIR